jgi:DNA polymerase-3 subunit alpha
LTLELGKPKLPDFPTPDGMDINEFLVHEAKRGLEFRLQHLFPNEEKREKERARYEARLKFEPTPLSRWVSRLLPDCC